MPLEALTKRVEQMEDLIADIPVMLNLRLETIAGGYTETGARLAVIDKELANLTRDVRDMRGAVTRQLIAQDERLRSMEAKLETVSARLDGHDKKLATMSEQLAIINDRLSAQSQKFEAIFERLPPRA